MIIYLTYNDQPSGVYWSQVTDVVAHLNGLNGPAVRLVAFVSVRGFWATRSAIKQRSPSAWVVPMVPRMKRWKWNAFTLALLCMLLRPTGIISRGVFATCMALRMRTTGRTNAVCFDGRGAYAAEWEEYRLIDDDPLIASIRPLEQEAVSRSDFRLAVTEALVVHWRERYDYVGDQHIVVPCTLGKDHAVWVQGGGAPQRAGTTYLEDDVVLVYSGSTAGWQSFGLLENLLRDVLEHQPKVKVLFLAKPDPNTATLQASYPDRVRVEWISPKEVARWLAIADHGIMVREDTLTNRVASPTKFAEYLAAGAAVLVSQGLGDFSSLVQRDALGAVVHPTHPLPVFLRTTSTDRQRLAKYAERHFTKGAYYHQYGRLLAALSGAAH